MRGRGAPRSPTGPDRSVSGISTCPMSPPATVAPPQTGRIRRSHGLTDAPSLGARYPHTCHFAGVLVKFRRLGPDTSDRPEPSDVACRARRLMERQPSRRCGRRCRGGRPTGVRHPRGRAGTRELPGGRRAGARGSSAARRTPQKGKGGCGVGVRPSCASWCAGGPAPLRQRNGLLRELPTSQRRPACRRTVGSASPSRANVCRVVGTVDRPVRRRVSLRRRTAAPARSRWSSRSGCSGCPTAGRAAPR